LTIICLRPLRRCRNIDHMNSQQEAHNKSSKARPGPSKTDANPCAFSLVLTVKVGG
jgi:hypothetical protein